MKPLTCRACFTAALLLAATQGCSTSSSRLYLLPAESDRIQAGHPMVETFDFDEAYHWTNDDGELCIAFTWNNGVPRGTARWRQVDLSLVLDEPPAGAARLYRLTNRSLRGVLHFDTRHRRIASLYGIAGVWFGESNPDGYRIRLRTWVNQQELVVWQDRWTWDVRAMLVGEIQSMPDADRGRVILSRTETDELKRPAKPTLPIPVTGRAGGSAAP